VTNPVTPSPDPWEVAKNHVGCSRIQAEEEGVDWLTAHPPYCAGCIALTALRTQAERQEAVLRQAKLEHDWLVGICRSEGRKEVEGPSPFREMYAALSPNPEGESAFTPDSCIGKHPAEEVCEDCAAPNPEGEQWRDDLDVGPRPSPLECYCAARAGEGHKLGDHTPTREKG
jgi:hypothetical protein